MLNQLKGMGTATGAEYKMTPGGRGFLAPVLMVKLYIDGLSEPVTFSVSELQAREMAGRILEGADSLIDFVSPLIVPAEVVRKTDALNLVKIVEEKLAEVEVARNEGREAEAERVGLIAEGGIAQLAASGWRFCHLTENAPAGRYPENPTREQVMSYVHELARETKEMDDAPAGERPARLKAITDAMQELAEKGYPCRDAVLQIRLQIDEDGPPAEHPAGASDPEAAFLDWYERAEKTVQMRGTIIEDAHVPKFRAAHGIGMNPVEAANQYLEYFAEWNPDPDHEHGDGCAHAAADAPETPPVPDAPADAPAPAEGAAAAVEESERYEFVEANVSDGTLTWRYKVEGADRTGSQEHDEDVSEWTDDQIIELTMSMLSVSPDQRDIISVEHD